MIIIKLQDSNRYNLDRYHNTIYVLGYVFMHEIANKTQSQHFIYKHYYITSVNIRDIHVTVRIKQYCK